MSLTVQISFTPLKDHTHDDDVPSAVRPVGARPVLLPVRVRDSEWKRCSKYHHDDHDVKSANYYYYYYYHFDNHHDNHYDNHYDDDYDDNNDNNNNDKSANHYDDDKSANHYYYHDDDDRITQTFGHDKGTNKNCGC
ncbi:putative mucin TcMUCII [Trypanosoma cruzi]|nr:putative mucin TcMUCII [Trypanosoma cruzi]